MDFGGLARCMDVVSMLPSMLIALQLLFDMALLARDVCSSDV